MYRLYELCLFWCSHHRIHAIHCNNMERDVNKFIAIRKKLQNQKRKKRKKN